MGRVPELLQIGPLPTESAQRSLAVVASASTGDRTTKVPEAQYPRRIRRKLEQADRTDKSKVRTGWWAQKWDEFSLAFKAHRSRNIDTSDGAFHDSVGGNGNNIANWLEALSTSEDGVITLHTWAGNDAAGDRLENSLRDSSINVRLVRYKGKTPEGLILPRTEGRKTADRTIFSYKSQHMPSEFASTIEEFLPEFAVVNSLGGQDWPEELVKGTDTLKRLNIPYIMTPGSTQLDAIRFGDNVQQKEAVYKAINGAYLLSVNVEELVDIVQGSGVEPANNMTGLLKQGKQLVGEGRLAVTNGAGGIFGVDADGSISWVAATRVDEVRGTLGAGDAATAGMTKSLTEPRTRGNMKQALRMGSATGSLAVEQLGAQENLPTREDVDTRMAERPPGVLDVVGSMNEIPLNELRTVFNGTQAQYDKAA